MQRCWYTYSSKRAIERPGAVPLIVHLHGAGGCASLPSLGWGTTAESVGMVVAWPQGSAHPLPSVSHFLPNFVTNLLGLNVTCWNDGTGLFGAEDAWVDDVAFLEQVIMHTVENTLALQGALVDINRIYMSGHSNGATMAQRFALQSPGILDGVVAVSGSAMPRDPMWMPGGRVSANYTPTPIALVHGSKDGIVPFDERRGPLAGAMASFDGWGRLNNCTTVSRQIIENEGYTQYLYDGCQDDAQVSLYRITGQGHHPFWKGVIPFRIASVNVIASEYKQQPNNYYTRVYLNGSNSLTIAPLSILDCPFRGPPWFSECDCALASLDSMMIAWEFIGKF